MGTTTSNSADPRTPVQRKGNILVLFVVLALFGAVAYGYLYSSASKQAGVDANTPKAEQNASPGAAAVKQ